MATLEKITIDFDAKGNTVSAHVVLVAPGPTREIVSLQADELEKIDASDLFEVLYGLAIGKAETVKPVLAILGLAPGATDKEILNAVKSRTK